MQAFRKGLAILLCAVLCIDTGCAIAEVEYEARHERLLRFATEKQEDWNVEDIPPIAIVTAEKYEQEKFGTPRDYSAIKQIFLEDFSQLQFEEILPKISGVRWMNLENCSVEDFLPLSGLPLLETLEFEWSGNLPRQLASLAKLPMRPVLQLTGVTADAGLGELTALANLEELTLYFDVDAISVCDLHPLTELPRLRSLKLGCVPITADLSSLAVLKELEELEISIKLDDSDERLLPELPELPKLRSLAINGGGGGWGKVVSSLPNLPVLEEFYTNADIDPVLLQHIPTLRVVDISGGDDFSPLSTLGALEKLTITHYLPDDLTPLYQLPGLRYLQIDHVGIRVTDYVDQLEALHEARPDLEMVLYHGC